MKLGKSLMNDFPVINIRRLGRNIIVINYKFISFDANNFVDKQNLFPVKWISYIPIKSLD